MNNFVPLFENLARGKVFSVKTDEKPIMAVRKYASIHTTLHKIHTKKPFINNVFYWVRDVDIFSVYHESQIESEK